MCPDQEAPAQPLRDSLQRLETCATGTLTWHKAADIACAIANQRHTAPGERGEDHFATFTVGQNFTAQRIDDLEQQVCLAQMVTASSLTLHAAAQAHLRHAIVIVYPAGKTFFDCPFDCLWNMIGGEEH